MRKLILVISALLVLTEANMTPVTAQNPIEPISGVATLLPDPKGVDIVYIFADLQSAMLKAKGENPIWLQLSADGSTTEVARGIDTFAPEDSVCYTLQTTNDTTTFCVIDYAKKKPTLQKLTTNTNFDNVCEQTELLLEAIIPEMHYQDTYGATQTIKHTCTITYTSLGWNGEEWQDSICVETPRLSNTIRIGAPLQNTTFTLSLDQFADNLGLEIDSISSEEYEAVAVDAHPTTITTTRGAEGELSNEVERPIEDTQLSGSAPLDIYFKTNATPAAKYYTWKLLRGSALIAQRTDAEQRYKFEDSGSYKAQFVVSNDYCSTDTLEVTISVSTSQLLVPNVFTPNGDGKNDEFRVMYRSIVEFHCWVYNRWGHLVYEWTDPAKGWDGTINGRPAAESAYFYVIRARGADYNPNETTPKEPGKKKELPIGLYELKGDINLIRGGHK